MHIPVLLNEVIENLNIKSNQNFIDCTFGDGGHSMAILEKNKPNGIVIGIDLDEKNISNVKIKMLKLQNLKERLILINDNFANLEKIIEQLHSNDKFKNLKFHGILLDLGFSSCQLEEDRRGFSFQKDEQLNMRYDIQNDNVKFKVNLTAKEIINKWPQLKIEKILKEYGEERFAKSITAKIIEQRKIRPIATTFELKEIIKKATPKWYHFLKIHPATKVFQALRIAVNNELENLKQVLPQAIKILE
jgi:16S rRNA (cytosine1402-N4)-methyltransferase